MEARVSPAVVVVVLVLVAAILLAMYLTVVAKAPAPAPAVEAAGAQPGHSPVSGENTLPAGAAAAGKRAVSGTTDAAADKDKAKPEAGQSTASGGAADKTKPDGG